MNTIELLVVLLDVGVLVFSTIAWARWRAAERPRRAIIAQYQRPHGLDIVQASVLIGRESVAPQAAILDLAVRGRLRIIATPVSYVIELLSIDGLSHNEGRVVNILFGQRADPGAVRYVPRRDRVRSGRWTRAESRIRAGARRGMAALGLIRPPGPTLLAVLSFLGGVFWPLTEGSALWHVATFTPMYGVAMVARSPLTHDLPWYAVVNAVAWLLIFVAGAAWRMSKDTARV